jgi:hypothetical protein
MFLRDRPFDGPVPRHLDPLLGWTCAGSGMPSHGVLEIPDDRRDQDWPSWRNHRWPRYSA